MAVELAAVIDGRPGWEAGDGPIARYTPGGGEWTALVAWTGDGKRPWTATILRHGRADTTLRTRYAQPAVAWVERHR